MPLLRLSARDAFANTNVAGASWPRSTKDQAARLMPLAKPAFTPSFRFGHDHSIFTIGSCFARNIETQLRTEGYDTAAAHFAIPADIQDSPSIQSILNRFICHTMLNEFRWALDPEAGFPDAGIVEIRNGKWFDLNNVHEIHPSARSNVLARRDLIGRYMARVRDADVVVMTLGLAEAWFDTETGHYINVAPHRTLRDKYPDRFEFHLLDYNDISDGLERIHDLLTRFGKAGFKMLVTVSPVAVGLSFSGNDVLTANTYSKAVQRAAVEGFVRRHDNVDYFPSYESVTLSDRRRAWRDDQAHASEEIVRLNVLRMIQSYGVDSVVDDSIDTVEDAYAFVEQAKASVAAHDMAGAKADFARAVAFAPNEALIRAQYAEFLIRTGDFKAAIPEATVAAQAKPTPRYSLYLLGRAYHGAGDLEAAHRLLGQAMESDPHHAGLIYLMARVCNDLGRYEEALGHIDTALVKLPADHPRRERTIADRERIAAKVGELVG